VAQFGSEFLDVGSWPVERGEEKECKLTRAGAEKGRGSKNETASLGACGARRALAILPVPSVPAQILLCFFSSFALPFWLRWMTEDKEHRTRQKATKQGLH
jgi:hypothetical protein